MQPLSTDGDVNWALLSPIQGSPNNSNCYEYLQPVSTD